MGGFVEMERTEGEGRAPFEGGLDLYADKRDVQFHAFEVDGTLNRFCADPSEASFFVTQILCGQMEITDRAGSTVVRDDGLFLFDFSRAVTTRNSHYTFCQLRLPRSLVLDAVGADPLSAASSSLLRLEGDGLAPFLSSQLRNLFEHAPKLGEAERTAALDSTVDLALALIRSRPGSRGEDRGLLDQALFRAAASFIERNAHRAELTPEWVAQAVGCSRARLYRLFAAREVGIHERIRETRLQRSCERLSAEPLEAIGMIAFKSGFTDPPTFNRAFKRRFGMSPSEWRAQNARRAS